MSEIEEVSNRMARQLREVATDLEDGVAYPTKFDVDHTDEKNYSIIIEIRYMADKVKGYQKRVGDEQNKE